jgi:hypothetical protein
MRHLYGIALAVVLSAAIFFGGGWGFCRLHSSVPGSGAPGLPAGGGSLIHDHGLLLALGAVLGAALLAGLLIVIPRVSPLATGLPGLGLIAWTVLYAVSVARAVHYIPMKDRGFGAGFEAMGISGVLGAAGIVLVMPMFLPSRWRRRPADIADDDDAIEATSVTSPSRAGLLTDSWKSIPDQPTRPVNPPEGW